MNKQESYDFNQTHQHNLESLARIYQLYLEAWILSGKPLTQEEPSYKNGVIKHIHILLAGALQRCGV